MIVFFCLAIGFIILAIVSSVLFLIHYVIYDNNANYAYWSSKARIRKITYGSGEVEYIAEKNKAWGLPFCWEKMHTSASLARAEAEVDYYLKKLSNKRIVKSTIFHAKHNH